MKRSERGFTLVEIMIVVAIIALLAAIAIPNVLRGRTTANEAAAIGNLRALVSSLEMYRSVNNSYPDNTAGEWLLEMYTTPEPDFGPPSFAVAMTTSTVQGFNYTYVGVAAGGSYDLLVNPATAGTTGTRSFLANETGLIRHCSTSGVATVAELDDESTIDAAPSDCD